MVGRLLSLNNSPISLSSQHTTTRHAFNSILFSPVRVVATPSSRPLQLELRHRMLVPVPRAGGPPSATTLLFALLLPLSLILGTVFATRRVDEQLDQKYLDELAMNLAILEENEMGDDELYEDDDDDGDELYEEEMENEELVSATQAQSQTKQES